MSVAATLDRPRVLMLADAAATLSATVLPRSLVLFDVLLHIGTVHAELRQLRDDQYPYDEANGTQKRGKIL